jgi:phage terminase small subunit
MSPRPLSPMQAAFVRLVLEGHTQSQAYRLAGYAPTDTRQTSIKSSQLAATPRIKQALADGRKALADEDVLTRKVMLHALAKIVTRKGRDAKATSRDVTGAIAQASKMLGCDAPTKVEMKVEGSLLHRIRNAR